MQICECGHPANTHFFNARKMGDNPCNSGNCRCGGFRPESASITASAAPAETERPLPLYRCHKEVRAVELKGIAPASVPRNGDPLGQRPALIPMDEHIYAPISIDQAWIDKHMDVNAIRAGDHAGWLVIYADGHRSWSPDKAFREGYHGPFEGHGPDLPRPVETLPSKLPSLREVTRAGAMVLLSTAAGALYVWDGYDVKPATVKS